MGNRNFKFGISPEGPKGLLWRIPLEEFGISSLKIWAIILWLWLPGGLSAQITSKKGWFTADVEAGCAPFSVTITHTGKRSGSLFIDFRGKKKDPFSTKGFSEAFVAGETHSNNYTKSGTYLIRVVDESGDLKKENRFDFLTVKVTQPVKPSVTLRRCNDNQVTLTFDFEKDDYDFYEVDFGDKSPIKKFYETGEINLKHIYSGKSTYTLRVKGKLKNGADTNCGIFTKTFTTTTTLPTPSIKEMTLVNATTIDFQYKTLSSDLAYELKQSKNGGAFEKVASINPMDNKANFRYASTAPNTDFNSDPYAFRIVAKEACSGTTLKSNTVQNIRASYEATYTNNKLQLQMKWNTQAPDNLLKNELVYGGTSETIPLETSGKSTINLKSCTEAAPFYFMATFKNALSRSITITPDMSKLTPPAPTGLAGEITGSSLRLTYAPAPFASEYRVYQVTNTGRQLKQRTSELTVKINDFPAGKSELCYILTYADECGNESPASDPVCFKLPRKVVLPTAFSPNNDNFNETFGVPDGIFLNFKMQIYNQWGSLVFASHDATKGWDGKVNGQPAPIGDYVYKINYKSGRGSPVSLTGSFRLIR